MIAIVLGAVLFVPSLVFLVSMFLRGHFDSDVSTRVSILVGSHATVAQAARWLAMFALACLLVSVALALLTDSGWAHGLGLASLCAFGASTFVLAVPIDH